VCEKQEFFSEELLSGKTKIHTAADILWGHLRSSAGLEEVYQLMCQSIENWCVCVDMCRTYCKQRHSCGGSKI